MGRTFNISGKARNLNFGIETLGQKKTSMGWLKGHRFVISDLRLHLRSGREKIRFSSVQSLSRVRLWNPMNHSTPGLPVHHQLSESTQTHVHRVGDTIQPSHPLLSSSPPASNPSQHQSLFQWVNSSHEVAKLLEFQLQHQSFWWTPRTDLL